MNTKQHLYISGMTCPQCPKRIAKALRKLDGVEGITVSLQASDAFFELDSSKTKLSEVITADQLEQLLAMQPSTPTTQTDNAA